MCWQGCGATGILMHAGKEIKLKYNHLEIFGSTKLNIRMLSDLTFHSWAYTQGCECLGSKDIIRMFTAESKKQITKNPYCMIL